MANVDEVLHITSIFYSQKIFRGHSSKCQACRSRAHDRYILQTQEGIALYKNIEDDMRRLIIENKPSLQLIILRPTMIFGSIDDGGRFYQDC